MARVTASTTAARGGSTGAHRSRPGGPAGGGHGADGRRAATVGAVRVSNAVPGRRHRTIRRRQRQRLGKSLRACAPRVSRPQGGGDRRLRAAVTRLASSPWARSTGCRPRGRADGVHVPRPGPASRRSGPRRRPRSSSRWSGPGSWPRRARTASPDRSAPGTAWRATPGVDGGSADRHGAAPSTRRRGPAWPRWARAVVAGQDRLGQPGPEHHALEQRVGGQPVGPVDPGAGHLAGRPQAGQRRRPVQVGEDAARTGSGRRGRWAASRSRGRARWPQRGGDGREPGVEGGRARWRPATGCPRPGRACARPWPG